MAERRVAGWSEQGAPTTGFYTVGDFIYDTDGTLWKCTVAGSPGTWVETQSGAYVAAAFATDYCFVQVPATAAAIPAAVTEFIASSRRIKADLTGAVSARTMANIADAWNAGAKVAIQYSLDEATWFYMAGTASGSAPAATEYAPGDVAARAVSGWATLPAAAKADVFLRMVTLDGDASTTGNAGHISLQVRGS